MNKGVANRLRVPFVGYVNLDWLARRGAVRDDGVHLHWDRGNRRWVTHEAARRGSAPGGGQAVRQRSR